MNGISQDSMHASALQRTGSRYTVRAEAITPIHCGSGDEIVPHEYVILKQGGRNAQTQEPFRLYRFHTGTLLREFLDENGRHTLLAMLRNTNYSGYARTTTARAYLHSTIDTHPNLDMFLKKALYSEVVSEEVVNSYECSIKNKRPKEMHNQLLVREFQHSLGRRFIPGSGLKGAIRTALTNRSIEEQSTPLYDPFKRLLVTDSGMIADKHMCVGKMHRSYMPFTFMEYMDSGATFNFDVILKNFLTVPGKHQNTSFSMTSQTLPGAVVIPSACNLFMQKKLTRYISELEAYKKIIPNRITALQSELKTERDRRKCERKSRWIKNDLPKAKLYTDALIGQFTSIKEQVDVLCTQNSTNEFIINIGFGGGYFFKTLSELDPHHPAEDTVEIKNGKPEVVRRGSGLRCKIMDAEKFPISHTYSTVHPILDIVSNGAGMPFGFVRCSIQ